MYKGNRLWKKEGKKQQMSKQIEKCPNHSDSDPTNKQTNRKLSSKQKHNHICESRELKISSHLTQKV